MKQYLFIVKIEAASEENAVNALCERLQYEEDNEYPYTIDSNYIPLTASKLERISGND